MRTAELQELVPGIHRAVCSIFAGGTCDCRSAEVTAPTVHEVHSDGSKTCLHDETGARFEQTEKRLADGSRKDLLRVFALLDMAIAADLRDGTISASEAKVAMLVMARLVEVIANLDRDFAPNLAPDECRQVLPRPGLDCPTRMMRIPEEEL